MKSITSQFLLFLLVSHCLYAEVTMHQTNPDDFPVEIPILDGERPIRPTRPVVVPPIIQYGEQYNTTVYSTPESTCTQYINTIKEKDAQIEILKKEIAGLRDGEQKKLQKSLKEEYERQLKEFDERRSN